MGNCTLGECSRTIRSDERGVSEILGTVLIFSFVIFLGIGLVIVGLHAFDSATAQTDDRLAQDSMLEMGDRLGLLTGSQMDTVTEFEFPSGSADDIEALDEGVVNVTIETHEDYVGLVEAPNASNSRDIDLGTILHEADDGTVTAYQGGALFERQGDLVEILQEPSFDYRGDAIDLSFNSIDIDQIPNSGSITAERLLEESEDEAGALREMMRPYWNLTGYDDVAAPVTITVTIESNYTDAWKQYVENRFTEDPSKINSSSDNELEIVFDQFDGGIEFDTNQTFDDDVFYSGEAALTGLVNVTNASIGGSDGDVEITSIQGSGESSAVDPDQYIFGLFNDSADEWVIYDTNDDKWVDLTGSPVNASNVPFNNVDTSHNHTYEVDPSDTWTCVVDGNGSDDDHHEEFTEYVNTSGEGCLADPLIGDAPDDAVASPYFNVTMDSVSLDEGDITTDDVVAGEDTLTIDWTVENDDVSNGTTPVVLLFQEEGSSDWIPLDKENVTLDGHGDVESGSFTVDAASSGNITFQVATLDTNDKDGPIEIVDRPDRGEFQIDSLSVPDKDLTAGEDLQTIVDINNTAKINDTQLLEMQFDEGSGAVPVAWEEISLNAETDTSHAVNWTTTNAFNTSNGEVTAETYHDTESEGGIEIQEGMETNATFEVDIEDVDPDPDVESIWDGDTVTVEANVTNVGDEETDQDIALLADGNVVDAEIDETLLSGESTTVSLEWDSTGHGGDNVSLTMATADDTDSKDVDVKTPTPTDYDISIDDISGEPVEPGSTTVTVEATVENNGDSDSPTVWLEGFEDRVVAVEDSVKTIGKRAGDPDSTTVTLEWDVPADVNTTDPEITVAVDGDNESRELDIESRLVVDDIQTTKETKEVATFSDIFIEDNSNSYFGGGESDLTVHYGVESGHSYDEVEIEFDGEGDVQEQLSSTSDSGSVTHSESGQWDTEYTITARIIDDDRIVDEVIVDDVVADGNNQNGDTSDDAKLVDSVTANATVENIGDTTTSDTVTLRDPAGNTIDDVPVTLSGGADDTVSLTWDDPVRTGSITVSTADDQASEQVIIERNGPYCPAVSYETDSEGRYEISNVDQLQCINERGLNEEYVLVDDIDASGTEHWNDGNGFEPIGPDGHNYPNDYEQSYEMPFTQPHEPFTGEFDGNGNLIEGLHIDRPEENFVGLFGATSYTQDFHPITGSSVDPGEGSLIKNVRLSDVHVVGEQHVGALAGQAGGTVENAKSEGYIEGQEQQVGGVIGGGDHADIDNRLVAEGTVIGGEIDASGTDSLNHEGIGGLVGRATWNTQISTAYTRTDVTGPKYVGAIVGTSSYRDSSFEQMYTNGTATATDSDAGAIVGHILSDGDEFEDSVYWDETIQPEAYGEAGNWYTSVDIDDVQTDWIGRTTSQMQGLDVNEPGRMGNLDFKDEGGPWVAVPGDYPRFQWELEAEGRVGVDIDEANLDSVEAGDPLDVPVTITNSNYEEVTQTIRLFADGTPVDSTDVTIDARSFGESPESSYLSDELTWNTKPDDDGMVDVEVRSEDETDRDTVEIETPTTGDYIVDSLSVDDPTTAGDVLTVTADITYSGPDSSPDAELVTLQNFDGGVVDSANVTGNQTIDLQWDTGEGLVSSGNITDDVTVGTSDDTETQEVTIGAGGDGDFDITNVDTNESITEGETLDVSVTIENVGSEDGSQDVLLRNFDDSAVDIESISLPSGETTTVDLTWDTAVGDHAEDDITVSTKDDTASESVEIEEQADVEFDVQIDEVRYNGSEISDGDTVEAGAKLYADVNVSNTGNNTAKKSMWVEFDGDTVAFISEVSVDPGDTESEKLAWNVHEATDGSGLRAKTANDSDTFDLTIEPVQTSTQSITSPGGDPIDIDLEEIAVE